MQSYQEIVKSSPEWTCAREDEFQLLRNIDNEYSIYQTSILLELNKVIVFDPHNRIGYGLLYDWTDNRVQHKELMYGNGSYKNE